MVSRQPVPETLTLKQRLALVHNTALSAEDACSIDDAQIEFSMWMSNGIKALNLQAAGLGASALNKRGVKTALQLRQLGFDALHLCEPSFASECQLVFGSEEVVSAFLQNAVDAVALAGMEAQHLLGITNLQLLERCAGFPGEAVAVLQQLPAGVSLHNIPASVLLDAGLRADSLKFVGYGLAAVIQQCAPNAVEMQKLGFAGLK